MKTFFYTCVIIFLGSEIIWSQQTDSIPNFNHNIQAYLFFQKDDFLISPMYSADKGKLHLEARYNYEDQNTFSGWIGYNFDGGEKFKYTICPEFGFIIGNTQGFAPGLKMDFEYGNFALNSESEYVIDPQDHLNNFYYNWTDISYSPLDWMWLGVSIQRTKFFDSDLEIQRGFLIGSNYKWLDISGYFYNPGTDDAYFVLGFSADFPVK